MATELWNCFADASQMESALVNLVVNARDAMPSGGTIKVATCNTIQADGNDLGLKPGEYVHISVSDEGTGIPEAHLDRLIEPFFTTKAPGKGAGLGLSMVYGLAKQSGGTLKIANRSTVGAKFTLILPRAESDVASTEKVVDSVSALRSGPASILLVEDEPALRRSLVESLEELGHVVLSAPSAEEALGHAARASKLDVLITDVVLRGKIDGAELAVEVHKLWPEARFLFMTGYAPVQQLLDPRTQKAVAPLRKPFSLMELDAALHSLSRL